MNEKSGNREQNLRPVNSVWRRLFKTRILICHNTVQAGSWEVQFGEDPQLKRALYCSEGGLRGRLR